MKSTGARWADIVRLRLRSLWRRDVAEAELDEELRFHFETLAERFEAEGLPRSEARRQAAIEMGRSVEAIREDCRDARGWSFAENLWRDVQYAVRGMARNPLFTLTAAGALALGIGVNSAVFTMVYSLMYRPLPVAEPETVRNVHMQAFGTGNRSHYGTQYNITWAEYQALRSGAKSAELAGFYEVDLSRKDDPRPVSAQLATENLLSLIGGRPALGRFFVSGEASSPGSAAVAVLSHRAWTTRFGADPGVVGRQVVLNRTPFTVVGVADEKTTGASMLVPDVWIPVTMQALTRPGEAMITNPRAAFLQVIGRLRPGSTDAAVQSELQVLFQNALPEGRRGAVTVAPAAFLNYPWIRQQSAPVIGVLFLAVGLVLIVACANVANMLLARGLARRKEIAVRLSIGAGRGPLLQQLVTESLLLSLLGGAAGIGLAVTGARTALSALPAEVMERQQIDLSPDGRVLLFTIVVSLLTGVVFGLVPAWNSLRFSLSSHLKAEGLVETEGAGRHRLQFALIAVQAAVSLVLLVNAGLLLRGFRSALTGNPGQLTTNVVSARFDFRQQQYTPEQAARFHEAVRAEIGGSPTVRGVSSTFVEPLHQQCGTEVAAEGGRRMLVACDEVGPDYFRTVGIRLLAGREFTPQDQKQGSRVAIIDRELARVHFGGNEALGKRIRSGPENTPLEIVGIADTAHALDLGTLQHGKIYTPMADLRYMEAILVAHYEGPFRDVESRIRSAVSRIDPNVSVRLKRVEESAADALLPAKIASAAASALGGFALLLAATGIYGVVAFAVTRRRKEIGIRVALGADRSRVMRLMIWQGMQPVLAGSVAGVFLAGGSAQLIRSMLYGVSPFDPVAFLGMVCVLGAAGAAAALLPARAALSVDPALTLRQE